MLSHETNSVLDYVLKRYIIIVIHVRHTHTQTAPGSPPTNIIVVTISPNSLTLAWSPPLDTNGNIIQFQAQLVDSVTGDVNVSMVTVGMVQWTGLRPYHTYKYRVAAATAVGLGPFSEERTVQTSEAGVIFVNLLSQAFFHILSLFVASPAPSQSPVNVTVTVTSSTTAHVTWSPPPLEAQNGIIRHYVICLEDNSTSVSFNSSVDTYILSGLHPASQYRVGVAAYTVEIGPKTDYTDFVTKEDGKSRDIFLGTDQVLRISYFTHCMYHMFSIQTGLNV